MTDQPQGEMYPEPIQKAYSYHNDYLDAVDRWQYFRDENARQLAIWTSIFWAFENAKKTGADTDDLRTALDFPGEGWGDNPLEMMGISDDTPVEDFFEGELPTSEQYDQLTSGGGLAPFIIDGRNFVTQQNDIEESARSLRNYMFYGGADNGPDDVSSGELTDFQEAFGRLSYISQVNIAKKLTGKLDLTEMGRHILATLVDPYYSADEDPPHSFRALYLLNPYTIWRDDDPSKYIVNVPSQQEVSNGNNAYLAMDSNDDPYAQDLKLANNLVLLAGQVMPGVLQWQAQNDGDLKAGNTMLANNVMLIDGGLSNTSWKKFKANLGADNASDVFGMLGTALSQGADILEQFEDDSKARYQVNDFESAGRAAKIRQHRLYMANFAGLVSNIGAAWGALGKINEGELDFTVEGAINATGGVVDLAELYTEFREVSGATYDSVQLRDGDMVKFSSNADDATSSLGKTVIDWGGKAMGVVDAGMSALTAAEAYGNQEYASAAFAGLGFGLALGGVFFTGWPAVIFGLAALIVGALQSWVSRDALSKWAGRTLYGDTRVTGPESNNPGSKWFGYNGYERAQAPAGEQWQSGKNRQMIGFYNVLAPFSFKDTVKISDDGGSYACSFTLKNLSMGTVGSQFILQPIYHTDGEYKVGKIAHEIAGVQRLKDFQQYQYQGYTKTKGDIELTVEPLFEGGAAHVNDASASMKEIQISLSEASSIADLFDLERSTIEGSDPAYLEVIHAPANLRSFVKSELSEALNHEASDGFVDTVIDHQPYPRQRGKLSIQ